MRAFAISCFLLWAFTFPVVALACEPIVPLVMLYSGTAVLGAIATRSLWGLLIAVVIKWAVFLWKSDYRKPKAIYYVTVANLYSMIPGIMIAIVFSAPPLATYGVGLAILYFAFLIPARNLRNYRRFERFSPKFMALILFLVSLATAFMWGLAMSVQETSYVGYWLLKIVYSIVAIGVSFLISVVCEDAVISKLYEREYKERRSFLEPVVWCNVVVFLLVVGLAAAIAIPSRLGSPGFLMTAILNQAK